MNPSEPINPRLSVTFTAGVERPVPGFDGDPSSLIPSSIVGGVVSLINELARTTWDYALSNPQDEKFADIRRLEAADVIQRRDIELVIVEVRQGSLEFLFDWSSVVFALGTAKTIIDGMLPNAAWDLIKYLYQIVAQFLQKSDDRRAETDPLFRDTLPLLAELFQKAYSPRNGVTVSTKFSYRDNQQEISFEANQTTQSFILEANQLETKYITRIVGSIVAIDYYERAIRVVSEQFPEQTIWCDISNLDLNEVDPFITRSNEVHPKMVAMEAEVAWKRGGAHSFPPDAARVIRILPEEDLMNPSPPLRRGLMGQPIYTMESNLTAEEVDFLKWFEWADRAWTDPNINGCISYLLKRNDVFKQRMSRNQLEMLIQNLVAQGIIMRSKPSPKRGHSNQVIRLNKKHPALLKYKTVT